MAHHVFGGADWLFRCAPSVKAHHLFGRADWVLGLTLLVTFAYFSQAGGWNQNSRFDLVRAIVEQGTTRIDAYVDNTGDRALLDGHAYSDKAPGQALTALPLAALWTAVAPKNNSSLALMAYAMTVLASSLATVIAAVCLAWSARALGASATGAAVAAIAFAIASPAFAYATLLWGHALAAGCLMVAFAAALALRNPHQHSGWLALLVGGAAGWAVVTEFPATPAAAILITVALINGRDRLRSVALSAALGACLSLAVLAIYNTASFGSPTFVSYSAVQGFAGMSEGLFGVTLPKRTILQEILFGQFRGLVPLAPAVVLAPIGLILAWRCTPRNRPAMAAAVLVSAYYLLFNSAYYYWDGGFSYGPRHIGAALPFLFLGLGPLWTAAPRLLRALIAVLITIGTAISTMAVSTIVMLPEDVGSPVSQLILPAFLHADLAQNKQSFLQYGTANPAQGLLAAWNLGQLAGMPGLWSLGPLMLIWAIGLYLGIKLTKLEEVSR
jgi:hypothetical protein